MSSGNSLSSFSRFGRVLYHSNGVWLMVFRYQRKCSQKLSQIFANIHTKYRGENIFWSSCSPYDKLSDEQSLYKYICPEGWDTWLPRMSKTFTNDMELNTLSQKRQNRTTCNLVNAHGSVPYHLIRMALDFFLNFPSKVGEIIMKYFNSAFMKFTVKDYTLSGRHLRSA